MKNRVLLSGLLLLMCLTLLCGCKGKEAAQTSSAEVVTTQTADADATSTEGLDSQSDTPVADETLFANNGVFNILILGIDNFNDAGISDTMMLLSVDKTHQKIKLTSFMRDTYLSLPGKSENTLNMAYALGGTQLATETVEQNFAVDIQRYALFNYFTFEDIINILGGVEIDLSAEEVLYINTLMEAEGEEDRITAKEGLVTLNGKQALCHMRNRGGSIKGVEFTGDDWDRTQRQRELVEALIVKFESATAVELMEIATSVAPYVNTDMTKEEMSLLVANLGTFLDYSTESAVVPQDGSWGYSDVEGLGSVIEITDWSVVRDGVQKFIYEN